MTVSAGHTITAVYSSSVNFLASTGTLSGSYAVTMASTTTTVSANPASGVFGAAVALTATVLATSPSTAPVNVGTVSFYDGSISPANLLGTAVVSAGTATASTSALSLNSSPGHTIIAVYSGDGVNLVGSQGMLDELHRRSCQHQHRRQRRCPPAATSSANRSP